MLDAADDNEQIAEHSEQYKDVENIINEGAAKPLHIACSVRIMF